MRIRQRALLLLFVLLVPATAGCNVRDWWDLQGTVHVGVTAAAPEESPQPGYEVALDDFQRFTIAVYGVSLRQQGEINPIHFRYNEEPLLVDLVELQKTGDVQRLAQTKLNLRPVDQVTVFITGIEAVDAAGNQVPFCPDGQRDVPRPCIVLPATGSYRHEERNFSPTRGGEIEFGMALEVLYSPRTNEYVVYRDPALAVVREP